MKGAPLLPGKQQDLQAVECHKKRATLVESNSLPQWDPTKHCRQRQTENGSKRQSQILQKTNIFSELIMSRSWLERALYAQPCRPQKWCRNKCLVPHSSAEHPGKSCCHTCLTTLFVSCATWSKNGSASAPLSDSRMTSATAAAASLGEAATATPTLAAARAGASFTPSPTCAHTSLFSHLPCKEHSGPTGPTFKMLQGWAPGQESMSLLPGLAVFAGSMQPAKC